MQPPGCTLEQYAALKQLPASFLREQGLSEISYMRAPAVRIPYLAEDGTVLATQYRTGLAKPERGPDTRFRFKAGDKPCLYGQ